jgi:hypothetical protein
MHVNDVTDVTRSDVLAFCSLVNRIPNNACRGALCLSIPSARRLASAITSTNDRSVVVSS